MVEGTPLLREHTPKKVYPGFESLRLRQMNDAKPTPLGVFVFGPASLVAQAPD